MKLFLFFLINGATCLFGMTSRSVQSNHNSTQKDRSLEGSSYFVVTTEKGDPRATHIRCMTLLGVPYRAYQPTVSASYLYGQYLPAAFKVNDQGHPELGLGEAGNHSYVITRNGIHYLLSQGLSLVVSATPLSPANPKIQSWVLENGACVAKVGYGIENYYDKNSKSTTPLIVTVEPQYSTPEKCVQYQLGLCAIALNYFADYMKYPLNKIKWPAAQPPIAEYLATFERKFQEVLITQEGAVTFLFSEQPQPLPVPSRCTLQDNPDVQRCCEELMRKHTASMENKLAAREAMWQSEEKLRAAKALPLLQPTSCQVK